MKAQWDRSGRRILLGDITGGGAVLLWLSGFQCVAVWISPVLTCIGIHGCWPQVYWILTCAIVLECNYCIKSRSDWAFPSVLHIVMPVIIIIIIIIIVIIQLHLWWLQTSRNKMSATCCMHTKQVPLSVIHMLSISSFASGGRSYTELWMWSHSWHLPSNLLSVLSKTVLNCKIPLFWLLEASSIAYELEAEAPNGELSFTLMPFWAYCLGVLFNTV